MGKFRGLIVLIAILLFVSPVLPQKLPWHPNPEVLIGVTRVLLVPPDVRVDKWTVSSGQQLQGTADHVRRTICGNLDQLFEQKKVLVTNYPLCLGEGEASLETQEAIRAVQAHFRELVTAWAKSSHGQIILAGFRLGDELAVAKKLDVDALVVVCANGTLTTKGEKALNAVGGLAGGGGPGESMTIAIGVIRPHSGELVFFTQKNIGGDFLKHEDRLEKAIEKAVQAAFGPTEAAAKSASK